MIPVVWLNYHPEVCNSPGMWDQGWVQETIAGRLFKTPYDYTNYTTTQGEMIWPDAPGIILVVPGRFHEFEARRVSKDIEKYNWVLMIVTSDEERLFPWWKVKHERIMTWVQTPYQKNDNAADNKFGIGSPPETIRIIDGFESNDRDIDVFFSGQGGHQRREACCASIERFGRFHRGDPVFVRKTEGFTQGFNRVSYLRYMTHSRVAPAPAGPRTVDTFRLWEALEAGCVPIADTKTDRDDLIHYWHLINQLPNERLPFETIDKWHLATDAISRSLANWQFKANMCGSWLNRTKREFSHRLSADLRTLGAVQPTSMPDDDITVLIPTSYIQSHPSQEMLWTTYFSVRKYLPDAEVLIMMDGNSPHKDYVEYQRRVVDLVRSGRGTANTSVKIFNNPLHQTGMTQWAVENFVTTKFVLYVEHDTPLTVTDHQPVPFEDLLRAMRAEELDYLRLHFQTQIHPQHLHMMYDEGRPKDIAGVPVIMTKQWSQRPHLAPTAKYREWLSHYMAGKRTFIEEIMHSVATDNPSQFKMGIYAPPGNMERSYHLDGRKS